MDLGVELLPAPAVVEGADAEGEAAGGAGSRAEAAGAPTTTENSTDRPETDAITDALVREVEFSEYLVGADANASIERATQVEEPLVVHQTHSYEPHRHTEWALRASNMYTQNECKEGE